jgi:tRNA(Ile)-lysidine synthase TilS/MesJ
VEGFKEITQRINFVDLMKCSFCRNESVYFRKNEGHHYCKNHFIKNIEKRVKKTIRINELIENEDRITADSEILLFLLNKIFNSNPKIKIFACDLGKETNTKKNETLLKKMRKLKLTKNAVSHNLDDECQRIIMTILKGNLSGLDNLTTKKIVPIICPLINIPEKELKFYAKISGIPFSPKKYFYSTDNKLNEQIRKFLNDLDEISPGIKYNLYEGSLKIMSFIRKKFK